MDEKILKERIMKDFFPLPKSFNSTKVYTLKRKAIERRKFPTPNILKLTLEYFCELPQCPPEEKVHWTVPFYYKGKTYAISYEKFGIYFYSENQDNEEEKELLNRIEKGVTFVENNFLKEIASDKIKSGNIIIKNNFIQLTEQYGYFRETAHYLFENNQEKSEKKDPKEFLTNLFTRKNEHHACYNAIAMIDAYYSRLEHLLLICLPFTEYNFEEEDIKKFISSGITDKLSTIERNYKSKKEYIPINNIREKYRNSLAHGRIEKDGQSFSFYLDNIGAIPVHLSNIRDSIQFNHIPIDKEVFLMLCREFDDFDNYLESNAMPTAWKYANSGLNLPLDEKNLIELKEQSKTSEQFDEWIEHCQYQSDRYHNAEY